MIIGIGCIWLRLPDNHSLKGKRQVVRSLTERVSNRFNVSIAEVDANDLWQIASLGVCCVSNDAQHARQMLAKVEEFIVSQRPDLEVMDYQTEVIHSEPGGPALR